MISSFLFLLTAIMAVLLMRHHKKEKKFGPGPSNGYTSGAGKKPPFWKRNKKTNHDAELGTMGAGSAAIVDEKHHKKNNRVSDIRPSHETGMTGSTAAPPDAYGGTTSKYAEPAVPTHHNNNNGYAAYTPQQNGTNYETGTATTTSGFNNTTHAHGHGQHGAVPVIHDPKPYAEVHHGGFPHTHPESERY